MNNSSETLKRKRSDEEVISIQDALNDQLEEEKNLIEEAKVQEKEDWGDENCCSFEKGYINQSVFACKTCSTNDKVFGFCYGCSMHCHLYHDIYELFHKKDFRCDCGTLVQQEKDKKEFTCQLSPISKDENGNQVIKKDILNSKNKYNHNFKGKYCYCDSVYDYKEDMIQCILCMDWFHEQCLKLNSKVSDIPSVDEFSDLICSDCVKKFDFLQYYPYIRVYIVNDQIVIDDPPVTSNNNNSNNSNNNSNENEIVDVVNNNENDTVSITSTTDSSNSSNSSNGYNSNGNNSNNNSSNNSSNNEKDTSGSTLTTESEPASSLPATNLNSTTSTSTTTTTTTTTTSSSSSSSSSSNNEIKCKKLLINSNNLNSNDLFCKENWVSDLCQCINCKNYYKENQLEFLFQNDSKIIGHRDNQENSVGDVNIFNKTQDTFEKIVPLQQQRALLEGYNSMTTGLKEFFSKKIEHKEVITKQDILSFFQDFKNKKSKNN